MKNGFKLALAINLLLISSFDHAWGNPQGQVRLSQESFVSPDYQSTQNKSFQFIGVGVDTLTKVRSEAEISNELHAQIHAQIAPGASVLNYLNVSQLFWKQDALILGRKKVKWNELDESFQMGLYQPQFSWNILQPESQGLTGLFLNVGSADSKTPFGLDLFASSIFVPDQGSGYEIKGGQFQKSNPYFSAPPTSAQVFGKTDTIEYNVIRPTTEEVVFNRSFAARAYLGEDDQGFFVQAGYANKPSNQLTRGFQGALTPKNTLAVDLLPAVYNHRIMSGDIQYDFGPVALGVSALSEVPEAPNYTPEWTYAEFEDSELVSPFIKFKFAGIRLKLAYLQVNGAEQTAVGPNKDLSSRILPQRFSFGNAYLAEVNYRYKIRRHQGILFSSRYLAGEQSEFALWTTRGSYQWQERWSAFFESQLALVEDNAAGQKVSFAAYENNDTASLGVQYVF